MTDRTDTSAVDTRMAALGWTRVVCDTCGHGVFTHTETGELVCRMCGEPYLNPSNSRELEPNKTTLLPDESADS